MTGETCTKQKIAELFGVTERRVEQLAQKKIIPKAGKGVFDLGPTVSAYIRYLHGLANGAISADTSELNQRLLQAQAEEREARASMARLELAEMEGRLHDAADVKKIMTDIIVALRSRILGIPAKLATTLALQNDPVITAETLRVELGDALTELAGYDAIVDELNKLNPKYIPKRGGDPEGTSTDQA